MHVLLPRDGDQTEDGELMSERGHTAHLQSCQSFDDVIDYTSGAAVTLLAATKATSSAAELNSCDEHQIIDRSNKP